MARVDFKHDAIARFTPIEELTGREAGREAARLREAINYHNRLYYVENRPEISDALYDKLFQRLEQLEQRFPELLNRTSPTQQVGGRSRKGGGTVIHAAPMLSLHAAADEGEVARFHEFAQRAAGSGSVGYVLEPKYDGVSIELVYRNGVFERAATRGDGRAGDDISHLLTRSSSLPQRLRKSALLPAYLAVRGEAVLAKRDFLELNRQRIVENLEPFANPRNAIAGMLHRLVTAGGRFPVTVVVYEILGIEGVRPATQHDVWSQLRRWGFSNSEPCESAYSLEDICKFHQRMEQSRDHFPYELDGIVIKIDDLSTAESLGTRHRSPRSALAWKFTPRQEITTLEDIVVQVGKSGKLTPVALLSPVDVGGVTVSRATLHNEREIHRKDIRCGDQVRIKRAGDVIPEVIERIDMPGNRRGSVFHMPEQCPACGTSIVHEQVDHFCPAGVNCPGQLVCILVHFASREALDIRGLGLMTARQLVECKLVDDVSDLFRLEVKDLLSLPGFGLGSATKLQASIQGAKRPPLDRFLYALAIRHVGQRTARMLAQHFGSLPRILDATPEELIDIVGPIAGNCVHQFFSLPANKHILRRLQESGLQVQAFAARESDQPLKGKTFVFTGTLVDFKRNVAIHAIECLGGQAASSVSSHTDFVVAGENPGTKLNDAQRLGIPVLDESEFIELLGR